MDEGLRQPGQDGNVAATTNFLRVTVGLPLYPHIPNLLTRAGRGIGIHVYKIGINFRDSYLLVRLREY